MYDVVVVGGGPCGATAALDLPVVFDRIVLGEPSNDRWTLQAKKCVDFVLLRQRRDERCIRVLVPVLL